MTERETRTQQKSHKNITKRTSLAGFKMLLYDQLSGIRSRSTTHDIFELERVGFIGTGGHEFLWGMRLV